MFNLVKANRYKLLGLGTFYVFFCRKSKDLWFENDFRETFPEIFCPYKRRFDFDASDNIITAFQSLTKDEEHDIIGKRRRKKTLEKESHYINEENNFNKFKK